MIIDNVKSLNDLESVLELVNSIFLSWKTASANTAVISGSKKCMSGLNCYYVPETAV